MQSAYFSLLVPVLVLNLNRIMLGSPGKDREGLIEKDPLNFGCLPMNF